MITYLKKSYQKWLIVRNLTDLQRENLLKMVEYQIYKPLASIDREFILTMIDCGWMVQNKFGDMHYEWSKESTKIANIFS